jgi:CHRD domain-containing protein
LKNKVQSLLFNLKKTKAMKTKTSSTIKAFIAIFILISIVAVSCKKDKTTTNNTPYTLSGNASGSQVVPSVTGNGTGTFTGSYNPANNTMTYTTNWSNLTGAPTSGGFYNGASGSAGTAVGTPWTMGTDWTGTGTYSGTMQLTPAQATQLTGGNWYYSMGTATNANGEIRGQISATR